MVRTRLRRGSLASAVLLLAVMAPRDRMGAVETAKFIRGDVDGSFGVDIGDAVALLEHLFTGVPLRRKCADAADVNDSGDLDIADPVYLLLFLFQGGDAPPQPHPDCGEDPTEDALACEVYLHCGTPREWTNSIELKMVYIPPGTFLMGSPTTERGRFPDEKLHQVTLTRGFYMGNTEVTQGQYLKVMGVNPSNVNGGTWGIDLLRPVENVTWLDATAFCQRLSELEGLSYRLPTEAQWEYACRAGTQTRFFFGDALECVDDCFAGHSNYNCPTADPYMFFCNGSVKERVGQKKPNPWGLHDLHDGVGEWCRDWYGPYPDQDVTDPTGPSFGIEKVIRAYHSWGLLAPRQGRSAYRVSSKPSVVPGWGFGFRVVLPAGDSDDDLTP